MCDILSHHTPHFLCGSLKGLELFDRFYYACVEIKTKLCKITLFISVLSLSALNNYSLVQVDAAETGDAQTAEAHEEGTAA